MPALVNKQQVAELMGGANQKTTKIRRTRQARNPQLSVARRNERERNRVKMVNEGFAKLRDHLPVEDLRACEQDSEDGGDTQSSNELTKGQRRAKKFSKVETLRAAIVRIRMLEELIRSTEPGFESMNIVQQSNGSALSSYDDEQPLSVGEPPLSCSSSEARSNSTSGLTISQHIQEQHQHNQISIQQQQQQQQQYSQMIASNQLYMATGAPASEHFVKLEAQQQQQRPHQHQHPHQQHYLPTAQSQPSPQDSHSSHSSQPASQYQTQVHTTPANCSTELPSHTHLWIQQHQNSFMEQQQEYYHYQSPAPEVLKRESWFGQQHTEQQAQQPQPQSAMHQPSPQHQMLVQSPASQQSNPMDSPVHWFQSGGSPASVQSGSTQISYQNHNHSQLTQQQPHQISLYSQ